MRVSREISGAHRAEPPITFISGRTMSAPASTNFHDNPNIIEHGASQLLCPWTTPNMAGSLSGDANLDITSSLHGALASLCQNPYPYVQNPASCKKRASVALILRIRPSYTHDPSSSDVASLDSTQPILPQLEIFFAQPWVRKGDAEVLFIKRAARQGDRWTSHVALPGGKRDTEDENDKATAVRETLEEVGLDLQGSNTLFIGNLPERVVSTSMGRVP